MRGGASEVEAGTAAACAVHLCDDLLYLVDSYRAKALDRMDAAVKERGIGLIAGGAECEMASTWTRQSVPREADAGRQRDSRSETSRAGWGRTFRGMRLALDVESAIPGEPERVAKLREGHG
jgi:hypothetical protein